MVEYSVIMIYLFQQIRQVLQELARADKGGDRRSMTIVPEQRLKYIAQTCFPFPNREMPNVWEILPHSDHDILIEISYRVRSDGWIIYHAIVDIEGDDCTVTLRVDRQSTTGFYEDIHKDLEQYLEQILKTQYSNNLFPPGT